MKIQAHTSVAAILVSCVACFADYHYVSTNGGCNSPYTTWTDAATNLALAITAATSGDTIIISNGTYRTLSATSVNKSLIVTSLYGAAQTVFDGNGQSFHCLRVVSGPLTSTVYGITVTNYFASAINLTAGSNSVLSLVDCVFRGNQYHAGGALYIYSGRLQATNCVFKGNRATHNVFAGGAINFLTSYPNNGSLVNCEISDNLATNGYAGGLALGTPVTMINCTVSNNISKQLAGGIYVQVAGSVISNCVVVDNISSNSGGGIYANGGSDIVGCRVERNRSKGNGGGIYYNGAGTVWDCQVVSNVSYGHAGGIFGGGSAIVSNCTVTWNCASNNAGGIYGCALIRNCVIAHNRAVGAASWGGGIGGSSALAVNCTIVSNYSAYVAGGVSRPWCDNSIIYYNICGTAAFSNYWINDTVVRPWTNCCTAPDPVTRTIGGTNCITASPLFSGSVPDAYDLASDSPCINAGTNEDWMVGAKDMAGHARLDFFDRQVDIGAYEYVSKGTLFLFMGQ